MFRKALVTGAGGFIGSHLVSSLKDRGYWVRGVDMKSPEFGPSRADEFAILDLRVEESANHACRGMDEVYALAADMGGMGYIGKHPARILRNNSLIDLHTIEAARRAGASRVFYASSACVYPDYLQNDSAAVRLREDQAYPAQPQDSYGWEKLSAERLFLEYARSFEIEVRIARFHNIYGPMGTWEGGREKAPAALSRKLAAAKLEGSKSIEVWGDGRQSRSFCYIDDCLEGIRRLMESDCRDPLNIGDDQLVSIDELAEILARHAGVSVRLDHVPGPQGVRGRNSDNTRAFAELGWKPRVPLEDGLRRTYLWIEEQVKKTWASDSSSGRSGTSIATPV